MKAIDGWAKRGVVFCGYILLFGLLVVVNVVDVVVNVVVFTTPFFNTISYTVQYEFCIQAGLLVTLVHLTCILRGPKRNSQKEKEIIFMCRQKKKN